MALVTPLVTYNSIKIGQADVSLSQRVRASFNAPHNRIDVTMTPTNCSLSYYEVRITAVDADYDIGVGKLAYSDVNVMANAAYSFSIDVNSTNFTLGDATYRIGLYARSAIDGSWDVTYLLFTTDGYQFETSSNERVEVLTTANI